MSRLSDLPGWIASESGLRALEDRDVRCRDDCQRVHKVRRRWTIVVGVLATVATANADEYRFGEWQGEIALAESPPITVAAYHFDEERTSSLQLTCTPPGWTGAGEVESPPVYHGMLMDLLPRIDEGDKGQSCTVQARAVSHNGEERIVSSEAVCEGSVVDVSRVDNWAGIEGLLRTAVRYSESGQTEVYPEADSKSLMDLR